MFALPESKVSSAELLFTSFVKKGKGINRTATALATGQVERRLFSPPEGVACCQHQMPFSSTQGPVQLGKQKKLMAARHPTSIVHSSPQDIAKLL
jgi:hypothetical protein